MLMAATSQQKITCREVLAWQEHHVENLQWVTCKIKDSKKVSNIYKPNKKY